MSSLVSKALGIISHDPREQHNLICYGGASMLRNAYVPLISGQTAMAFSLALGLSTTQMGLLSLPFLIVGLPTMILSTAFLDRIRNRPRFCGWLEILGVSLSPTLTLALTIFAVLRGEYLLFPLLFIFGILGSIFSANYGSVDAMLFSRSIQPDHRGKFFGLIGIIGGIIGIIFSLLASVALKYIGFPYAFTLISAAGLIMIYCAAFLKWNTRELPELVGNDSVQKTSPLKNLVQIFKMKEFTTLMPANLLRGFGDGAGSYAVVVGMRDIGLPLEIAGYATAISCFSSLVANTMIGKFADRFGAGRMIFPTVVLLCIGLMGMVYSPSAWIFLAFYLLWQIMQLMEATEIPLVHYDVVPVEVMGAFSSIRLLLLNLTASLSGTIVGISLDICPAAVVFAVCAMLKIISSLLFWHGSTIALRRKREAAAAAAAAKASQQ